MSITPTIPFLLQLKDAVSAIHLSENEIPRTASIIQQSNNITLIPNCNGIQQICIQPQAQLISKNTETIMEIETQDVSQVAHSEVNFLYEIVCPEQLDLKPMYNLKRGRPKKKKIIGVPVDEPPPPPKPVKPAPRTRSGRLVKFPKYIEKDFKKVETDDCSLENDEPELKTSEFIKFIYKDEPPKNTKELQLEHHQRRRKISSQYRCPKCGKAYLGKLKMVQHLKKYPDHGPLPHKELNFDVWNYLVDITQKCPPTQRGIKFCEELTNLLHNVLLLTSALFKKAEFNKNNVDVDKVLGNAIGLPPGPYKFNENELYKDVTVLKLITNSDFFKPVSREQDNSEKPTGETESTETKIDSNINVETVKEKSKIDVNDYFNTDKDKPDVFVESKVIPEPPVNVCITEHPATESFIKVGDALDRLTVHTDLLSVSENSLLNLPNLRHSEDDLILSGTNLLDNSTSSDEVMNVDQFVNERFKKITEPEIELGGPALNLDLPSLDLFQFHGS